MKEKVCSKCGELKSVNEFTPRPERSIGYRSKCKACERLCRNDYNRKNKEHVALLHKLWVEQNPEKAALKSEKYNKSEKGKASRRRADKKRLKSHNEYARQRYFTDPQWNMNMKLRRRVDRVLRQRKINKSAKTMELLGCAYSEYTAYIESLFTPEMTWEKVLSGEIQIDHIIPCASFDLTSPEQQKQCFHYTNLQPLWETTRTINGVEYMGNLNKSNKTTQYIVQ